MNDEVYGRQLLIVEDARFLYFFLSKYLKCIGIHCLYIKNKSVGVHHSYI